VEQVNHGFAGELVGAGMMPVVHSLQTIELVNGEPKPGVALFSHANLLFRSKANFGDRTGWLLISCYCAQSNLAYNETSTSRKTPAKAVRDEAIPNRKVAFRFKADFLKHENDSALKNTGRERACRRNMAISENQNKEASLASRLLPFCSSRFYFLLTTSYRIHRKSS
jgi:hypothetical protein